MLTEEALRKFLMSQPCNSFLLWFYKVHTKFTQHTPNYWAQEISNTSHHFNFELFTAYFLQKYVTKYNFASHFPILSSNKLYYNSQAFFFPFFFCFFQKKLMVLLQLSKVKTTIKKPEEFLGPNLKKIKFLLMILVFLKRKLF